jgi:hypothetical protein
LNYVRPSANAKGDEFLRNVIGLKIPALEAVKHMAYIASGSSYYRTHDHIVDAYADVDQLCTALVEEEVFTFKAGRAALLERV